MRRSLWRCCVATETVVQPPHSRHNAEELEHYLICPECNTLHHKVAIPEGSVARCTQCGAELYHNDPRELERTMVWSLTGLILFVTANLFPLVRIDFLGKEYYTNAPDAVWLLIQNGYYLVSIAIFLMVIAVPLLVMIDYLVVAVLMRKRMRPLAVRRLLIVLSHLKHWSMADIFLVSILVALIKLSDDVAFRFGVSFWAMVLYVGIDLYLVKYKRTGALWEIYRRRYHA